MAECEVLRVRNPGALQLPSLRRFLREALSTARMVEDVNAALDELDYWVVRDHAGLFIIREDGHFAACGFMQWGESAFAPHATLVHVYNRGTPAAFKALNKALRAYMVLGGYDRMVTLDLNDKKRALGYYFGLAGGRLEPLAMAYQADFSGEHDDGRKQQQLQAAGPDPG